MHLYDLPLVFAFAGLALYTVLGGADFGAGFWQLIAGRGESAREIRDHAHHAMGPVWEANHVWLIFVLTVTWTAYPAAFGSIASTLSVPLFLAGLGIVLRGGAYALRSGTETAREERRIDTVFAISSILTPFALGTVVGGIASARVHVGNPGGSIVTSWLNPTSITIGVLAVASAAYMAAVFLSGDATRDGHTELAERFRRRALAAGVVAGAVAAAGIVVLHHDSHRVFTRLTEGPGLPALVVSAIAGIATLALVATRRYEPSRYSAAAAVAATIAGWALAQQPLVVSNLTVAQAAAPHSTQVAVIVAVIVGGVLLFPSLALLFRLTLAGRLAATGPPPSREALVTKAARRSATRRLPVAALLAGIGFLTVAQAGWAHALGVLCLLAFVALGYRAILNSKLLDSETQ